MPSHPAPPTASVLAALRRQAKLTARSGTKSHLQALDAAARDHGWPSWREMQAAAAHEAQASPATAGLPVDPALPADFDSTPNEDRPQAQIDEWWERPYVLTRPDGRYVVRCLDGGAWDRSTNYGVVDTLEEAAALAERKLSQWLSMRAHPIAFGGRNGKMRAALEPRRPGDDFQFLTEEMEPAQLSQWLLQWEREHHGPAPADPEFMGGSAKRHLSKP